MKYLCIMIGILFLMSSINGRCQERVAIQINSYEYQNELSENIKIYSFEINNMSSDTYMTWISDEWTDNLSDEQLIRNYFFKHHGDFTLASLIYEGLNSPKPVTIGLNFIKSIDTNEKFTYYILDPSKVNYYKNRIIILKRKDVEDYIKTAIPTNYLWHNNSIILK